MNTKIYILIPHYERWDLTHARLLELYKKEKDRVHQVVILDDCSMDDMTAGGMKWWAEFRVKTGFPVKAIKNEDNLGFLRNCNNGISQVLNVAQDNDIIILLSNDVKIMSPFTHQVEELLNRGDRLVGGVLYSHDTGWNKFGDTVFPYLEGWLLAAKASTWKTLELFDERYAPSDFEDVDLSTLALKYGYELVPLNNPGLQHIGGQSIGYTPERLERTKINQKKFEEKWTK